MFLFMEYLLHYTWKHRLFPLHGLLTTDGDEVEVISPGRHNHDAGPDFLDARLRIGDTLWVGNVEIHLRSSDWYRHHHDVDAAYDTVVLHVVQEADVDVLTSGGVRIPQLRVDIPREVSENYNELSGSDCHPRCREVLPMVPRLAVTSWLSALSVERLEQRTLQIMERRERCGLSWEDTAFVTVARTFGFGKNGDAFERWALALPTGALGKHRDDLFQVEALFFGMAGLLAEPSVADGYYSRLQGEWRYLSRKFSLTPIDPTVWKFLRLRPQNFPHRRIAQLAMLYHVGRLNLSRMIGTDDIGSLLSLFDTDVSDFWQSHYSFTSEQVGGHSGRLSVSSQRLVVLNSVVPLLFAYGRYRSDEVLTSRALDLLEQLPPESNHIIDQWRDAGVTCRSAADSQALIQLTTRYCDAKDCLRCRFGYEYIRHNPGFLKEKSVQE